MSELLKSSLAQLMEELPIHIHTHIHETQLQTGKKVF
jgi:hypothetical protein